MQKIDLTSCKHRLVEALSTEKAEYCLLGAACGFGGSLDILLVDAYLHSEITPMFLLMIGLISLGLFVTAAGFGQKVKA